jgi:hypothetical protein
VRENDGGDGKKKKEYLPLSHPTPQQGIEFPTGARRQIEL